jgi:hypothetical protein
MWLRDEIDKNFPVPVVGADIAAVQVAAAQTKQTLLDLATKVMKRQIRVEMVGQPTMIEPPRI